MGAVARFIFFRIMKWKLLGSFPRVKKCVVIVAPHTHWLDFPLGLIVRKIVGIEINYIGKKGLFKWPYGWFFRWTGGAPVDRSGNKNSVESAVELFKSRKIFRLALAPEGTRKKVARWRSGFYYIALNAGVPLVMVSFDFGKKEVRISEAFSLSGEMEKDQQEIATFYKGVLGRVPEYT